MSGRQGIRLVLADVDGTLVTPDKLLTPRALTAVKALDARGIYFAITSGRPPRGMSMLIEPLGLTTAIAGFNGGIFVRPDLKVLEAHILPGDIARRVVALILGHGVDVWVYTCDAWLIRDPHAPYVDREQQTVKFAPTVVTDFGTALDSAIKIVGISEDLELIQRCEAEAQQALGTHASAARSQPYYLDVTHPSANKRYVVDYLSRAIGIAADQIATIGDMPNDVLMFRESGLSIAMGNASLEVQKQAQFVTASNTEDGFAKAVEYYLLGDGAEAPLPGAALSTGQR